LDTIASFFFEGDSMVFVALFDTVDNGRGTCPLYTDIRLGPFFLDESMDSTGKLIDLGGTL